MSNLEELQRTHGLTFSLDDFGTPQIKKVYDPHFNPDDLLEMAARLCFDGQLDEGIKYLEQLLENSDYRISALQNLANAYYEKCDFQTALDYALQALDINYFESFTHRTLCKIYGRLGDFLLSDKHMAIGAALSSDAAESTMLHAESFGFKNNLHEYFKRAAHSSVGQLMIIQSQVDQQFKNRIKTLFLESHDKNRDFRAGIFDDIFGDIDENIECPVVVFDYGWMKSGGYNASPYIFKELKINDDLTDKTLLIYTEQGIGDNIIRFNLIKQIKEKYNCKIYYVTYNSMQSFAQQCPYIDKTLPMMFDAKVLAEIDYSTNIFNLFEICHLDGKEPWLTDFGGSTIQSNKPKVLVNWLSRRKTSTHSLKQIDVDLLGDVLNKHSDHFDFFTCQLNREKDAIQSDIDEFNLPVEFIATDTVKELADCMTDVDLVISCDTMHVHMAGAMHKQCFVLLRFDHSIPMWGTGLGSVSHYPSVEIFNGDGYMDRMSRRLNTFLAGMGASKTS